MQGFKIGDRVRLLHAVDRYPHFLAPEGATGTVSEIQGDELFAVRMDAPIDGAEDWDNEIHWYPVNGDSPARDLSTVIGG